jgi:hypothetical protein
VKILIMTKQELQVKKEEVAQLEAENNYWKQNVIAEELRARYQKARYEVMHFMLEAGKIEEDYKTLLASKFVVTEQKEVTPVTVEEDSNVG